MAGFGFIVGNAVKSILEKIKKELKLETELAFLSVQLFHRDGVRPKVPICGG